jgi:hypothetical protein
MRLKVEITGKLFEEILQFQLILGSLTRCKIVLEEDHQQETRLSTRLYICNYFMGEHFLGYCIVGQNRFVRN